MYKTKQLFFVACIGLLLFGIGLITLGSIATGLKEKFQLTDLATGTLFSILPIGILTGSLVFGPLCDRYGYKTFLVLSCLCLFAGFQGIAWSSSLTLLKISIYFFGLAGGAINGATNAAVADTSTANKGAALSLLGVSFSIGAFGFPFVLAALEERFPFDQILTVVSLLALASAVLVAVTKFPPPKQTTRIPFHKNLAFFKDGVLLLIAFFLFCQSSFEGIINNWTTTYLQQQANISQNNALYALSLYVAGMGVMRLLNGTVLRSLPNRTLLYLSFALMLAGTLFLKAHTSFPIAATGLILLGAGLAAGFPVMLGIVGNRYPSLSGTAFSFVLVVALLGNMMVNYLVGIIAQRAGIQHLTTVALVEITIMILLTIPILQKTSLSYQ